MAGQKRLVLFVEGEGDALALPPLVSRVLPQHDPAQTLFLDGKPFRVGDLGGLVKSGAKEWIRLLKYARKTKKDLAAVLLVLDGDSKLFLKQPFCAKTAAFYLSEKAKEAGAGTVFSAAPVFALREYESWLIAGLEGLTGRPLPPDDRPGIKNDAIAPDGDLEASPRDAKGCLGKHMASGYKQTTDQAPLTKLLVEKLDVARRRGMRSFRRFEEALAQLAAAVACGKHIVTPEESKQP